MKLSYLILILGALTLPLIGCAQPQVFDSTHGIEHVGSSAADVSRSRVLEYDDDLAVFQVHIKNLTKLRDMKLKEARSFQELAGKARMDTTLLPSERKATVEQYMYLARRSAKSAAHCNDVIHSYMADASLVHAKRNQQVVEANRYAKQLADAPPK